MEYEVLVELATMIAGFAFAALSPGPNLLAVAATALAEGRLAALTVVAGIATGAIVWSLAMFSGVSSLVTAFPAMMRVFSLVGAVYLSWLAFRGFRSAMSSGTPVIAAGDSRSGYRAWLHGLTVTLANPKALLFYASLAVFINGLNVSREVLFGMAIVLGFEAAIVYGIMAVLFSADGFRRFHAGNAHVIDFLFACAFSLLALLMIF